MGESTKGRSRRDALPGDRYPCVPIHSADSLLTHGSGSPRLPLCSWGSTSPHPGLSSSQDGQEILDSIGCSELNGC